MVLYHWRIKLKIPTPDRLTATARSAQALPTLVALQAARPSQQDTASYEIAKGPWCLRFSGDFEDQSLQRILRLLPC